MPAQLHRCDQCGYTTKKTSSWNNHLKRKTPCVKVQPDVVDVPQVPQIEPVYEQEPPEPVDEKAKCPTCYKTFSKKSNMQQHKCKLKPHPFGCSDCFATFPNRQRLYYHRKNKCTKNPNHVVEDKIEKLQEQIRMLEATLHPKPDIVAATPIQVIQNTTNNTNNTTNHHVTNNTVVNNTQNIHINNVQVVSFGMENDEILREILRKKYKDNPRGLERRIENNPAALLAETIQYLHFNRNTPEHWNIYQSKAYDKYLKVFNQPKDRWEQRLRDDVYNDLIDNSSGIVEDIAEEVGADPRSSFEEHFQDQNTIRNIKNKVEETLLNNSEDMAEITKKTPDKVPKAWIDLMERLS